MLDLQKLQQLDTPPSPYDPGENIWTDPYLAERMLEAHLSPQTDAASYRPWKINAICNFLPLAMKLSSRAAIIDLGCGPGLYCAQLAAKGYRMTGLDQSPSALAYAKTIPANQDTRFMEQSYLQSFGENQYDAALLIYEDYGVLPPQDRMTLLENIHRALKPGGWLAFDVCSENAYRKRAGQNHIGRWSTFESGFWRPHPHAVLEKSFLYPDIKTSCDLTAVLDENGLSLYRVYQTFFDIQTLRQELAQSGFILSRVMSHLDGSPLTKETDAYALLAKTPQLKA